MIDNFGRDINYFRVSVTDRCNLRCLYCMPRVGVPKKRHEDILSLELIYKICQSAVALGIKKIRLTGGEPLIRKNIVRLVRDLAGLKRFGLRELTMTTNAVLLAQYASELKAAGLDRVNISLDSLREEKFTDITGRAGAMREAQAGLRAALEAGLSPVKVNVVLIGGVNEDEIEDFVNLTREEGVEVRFIELMPLGEAGAWEKARFIPNTEVLRRVPRLVPIAGRRGGMVARLYRLPEAAGTVGLISPLSSHFCAECNRIRLTPDGKLKPCLHSAEELDFRAYGENRLSEFLSDGIRRKPDRHMMRDSNFVPVARKMHEIGG
ncbi:MAG: GTP 3',8-cyclase MoaA [Gracilibacteraceae bacterium]|jgi:cyclic pyranopterin phosphate synthase|nr:GTP 3',8-cyclase MoaA [Gracilibacteraceae bacterium]